MPILNPLFQSLNWTTAGAGDPRGPGNQQPADWILTVTQKGAVMAWPTKHSGQGDVAAQAGGPGEYVHKLHTQLPVTELFGTARALLVLPNTDKIYKAFGSTPNSMTLSQTLRESPGTKKQYSLFILGETPDKPTPPNIDLESDHFRARFSVGGVTVESSYADMKGHKIFGGNERPWNQFIISAFTFPASGEAVMSITTQQNWLGSVDFFIAGITEQTISGPNDPGTGVSGDAPAPDKYTTLEKRLINLASVASLLAGDVDQLQVAIQNTQVELARVKAGQ